MDTNLLLTPQIKFQKVIRFSLTENNATILTIKMKAELLKTGVFPRSSIPLTLNSTRDVLEICDSGNL